GDEGDGARQRSVGLARAPALGIAQRDVLDLETGALDLGDDRRAQRGRIALAARAPQRARGREPPPDRAGAAALVRAQELVARRARQPVRLALGRTDDDARIAERAREVAHDERLLEVLLAEVGALGHDELEQPLDDRRDSAEVAGPVRA